MKTQIAAIFALVCIAQIAQAKPWIQGVDLPLPREVDIENPVVAHETDCHVYYVYNYPMTCGEERVFNPATLVCDYPAAVADSRPECADAGASDEA